MSLVFSQAEKDAQIAEAPHEPHDRRAHIRIDHLEAALSQHVEDQKLLEDAIRSNTELTQEIARNTTEIVTLFRGAKAVRTLVLWWAPIAAGVAATIAWFKGIK